MVKGLRACPICPICGSKKFKVAKNTTESVIVQCLNCANKIFI